MLHQFVVHVGEYSIIDLEQETSANDFEVFLAQRVRDCEDVRTFVFVVFVDRIVAGAPWCDGRQKSFRYAGPLQRALQVVDVAANALASLILDWTDARMTRRTNRAAWKTGSHEIGEPHTVTPKPHGFEERVGTRFETGHPVEHVICPARLSVLSIVDDVNTGFSLLGHHPRRRLL